VLARLLHRYDLTGDPEYELAINERLTLMPKDFEVTLAPTTPASCSWIRPEANSAL
jgi:unspecific monooxygenase